MTDTPQEDDDFGGAGWCCAVLLHNAPQLDDALRKQAEDLFTMRSCSGLAISKPRPPASMRGAKTRNHLPRRSG